MGSDIRKVVSHTEHIFEEGGRAVEPVLRLGVVAAVVRNPWYGKGYVDDLQPEIDRLAPILGDELVPRLIELFGSAEHVEAYGKAAVVGTAGEIEHASALIHTLKFGNKLRDAAEGTSFLPFTNTRAAPGSTVYVPLKHKTEEGTRSHFLTTEISIPDAPSKDEILVAIAAANRGRPHARIGDRYRDMEEMRRE